MNQPPPSTGSPSADLIAWIDDVLDGTGLDTLTVLAALRDGDPVPGADLGLRTALLDGWSAAGGRS